MDPITFEDLDEMETWVKDNQDKVARHLLSAWQEVIEEEKESMVVVRASPKGYHEDMDIIVERDEAKEALDTLLDEAIEREDYEIAKEISSLQEKVT